MNLVEQVTDQLRSEISQGITQAKEAGRINFEQMPAFVIEVPKAGCVWFDCRNRSSGLCFG